MSNLPTPDQINADARIVTPLPLDVLRDILADIDARSSVLSFAKKAINNSIADRVNDAIVAGYIAKGVDTGVVHIERDGLDVVVDRSKTVTWDQAKLAKIAADMKAGGDDPAEYLKVAYSVPEANYAAWPSMIRKIFEPARTVKPGNPTIKLADLKQEAA